jgi:hypothetical protein
MKRAEKRVFYIAHHTKNADVTACISGFRTETVSWHLNVFLTAHRIGHAAVIMAAVIASIVHVAIVHVAVVHVVVTAVVPVAAVAVVFVPAF